MFYVRINKIKVFNNREGFLGLFNRAEMHIYSYVTASSVPFPVEPAGSALSLQQPSLSDLLELPDEAIRNTTRTVPTIVRTSTTQPATSATINSAKEWIEYEAG
jgi:hypothetical protein